MKKTLFGFGLLFAAVGAFASPKGFTIVGTDNTGATWSYDATKTKDLVLERPKRDNPSEMAHLPVTVFYVAIDMGDRHAEGYGAALCKVPGLAVFSPDPSYDYSDLHPDELRLQKWAPEEVPAQMLSHVCAHQ